MKIGPLAPPIDLTEAEGFGREIYGKEDDVGGELQWENDTLEWSGDAEDVEVL